MTDFDIAIRGAGPVGLTLALLLVQRGVSAARVALIDAKPLDQISADPRSIALSYGSRQILEQAGVWPIAADAIRQIHVSRRGHFGRTLIDSDEYGLPALGYVARYGVLTSALSAAAVQAGIAMLRPAHVSACIEREAEVELSFADGKSISARIAVQAEGGLFSEQNAKSLRRDYGQTAIVAHVMASAPVMQRAYERFTDEGPLALLPQDGGYAMVWCMQPDSAARLIALPDTDFLAQLGSAFGSRLGKFTAITPRASYPLGLNARAAASARTVAIGNASQTLHPVAGQGLNLGLRDGAVLAGLLARDASPHALQRFAADRQADRGMTIRLTDTMARIFANAPGGAPLQAALGLSLGLIDTLNPAKRALAEQMMFGQR